MKTHCEKYKTSVKIEYIFYKYILQVGVEDGGAEKKTNVAENVTNEKKEKTYIKVRFQYMSFKYKIIWI